MEFKLYSQLNVAALTELKPDFGYQSWTDILENDRYKIWKYLEYYFFDKDKSIAGLTHIKITTDIFTNFLEKRNMNKGCIEIELCMQ